MPSEFVHLHVHTEYSLLDGACRIDELVNRAAELEMPAMAITDHGVMYGAIEFYEACHSAGIKPIIGCEVYCAQRTRFDREARDRQHDHLVLLAKNHTGYRNLMRLVTDAHLEGFYYKPRVDTELLAQYSDGLIAMTACLQGAVARRICDDDMQGARQNLQALLDIFGPDNVYLELMNHRYPQEQVMIEGARRLSEQTGVPTVATNDVHYTRQDDAQAHDTLLCIQTNSTVDDPDRMRFDTEEFYLKSAEQMHDVFPEMPEAIARTQEVADRCEVELDLGKLMLPDFPIPEGHTADSYLRKLCEDEIPQRYPDRQQQARQRLDYELGVISECDYSGYFLIVGDFITEAKSRDILVGPGRGSATGSIVAYLLGISEIDPLNHGLIFERMLNPDRASPPDIDLDFPDNRRDEIIEYVRDKYGHDRVAQVITFNRMQAKAAIRDCGRLLDMDLDKVDRVAKAQPGDMTIAEALEMDPDVKGMADNDPEVQRLLERATRIEGLARHAGVHAAAVVISNGPLTDYVPLCGDTDGTITTQYSMDPCEDVGLVKMDFLGLKTLTIIENTVQAVRRSRGEEIDIMAIDRDDPATYELLSRGDTGAVFQLESDGMRQLLRQLQPQCFEHLVPLVALYRPGPMDSIPDFVNGRHGGKTDYPTPELQPILEETYGVILYQEQVMRVATDLAGFTMPQAEIIMRAMAKKQAEKMERMKPLFIEGCIENDIPEQTTREIFRRMETFSRYGFNKSHSAAYALVAYWTAYLKANYPAEFLAAQLTTVVDKSSEVAKYVNECRRSGIDVRPPDVNVSFAEFSVEDGDIVFGLAAVRGVGMGAAGEIASERAEGGPYKDLLDFCERVRPRGITKSVVQTLIQAGALQCLGHRAQLLSALDRAYAAAEKSLADQESGQVSLFGGDGDSEVESTVQLPDVPQMDEAEIRALEKELLGLYLTSHPIIKNQQKLNRCTCVQLQDLDLYAHKTPVVVGGTITRVKHHTTSRNRKMAFVTLEDLTAEAEVTVFSDVFEESRELLVEDAIIVMDAKIDRGRRGGSNSTRGEDADEIKLICDRVRPLDKARKVSKQRVEKAAAGQKRQQELEAAAKEASRPDEIHIELDGLAVDEGLLARLRELLQEHKGNQPVVVHFAGRGDERAVALGPGFRVHDSRDFPAKLRSLPPVLQIWHERPEPEPAEQPQPV